MEPNDQAQAARRHLVLFPGFWVVAAVGYALLLVTAGAGSGWPAHAVQALGPLMLVLAVRDMTTTRAREPWTGDPSSVSWLLALALLMPTTLVAMVLLVATV
ncbi:MAG TPA: hypothetical protein VH915_13735 [Pedococcus sp.]|jgi:hypothetical protein